MPTVETSTWLALRGRVETLVLSPVLPIAWPNESYDPPNSGYLRVAHLPNTNRRLFLGSAAPHQRIGLLQIDVFAKLNRDAAIAVEIAGQVAAHFPADLKLASGAVTLRVVSAPEQAPGIADDTHWQVPVTVRYEVLH